MSHIIASTSFAESVARQGMVAAAHPLAAEAGLSILKQGGNAMDAAIATAFALGVVEPHASGIGGGGFLLYYDAKSGKVTAIDYRESAPEGLSNHHFRSGTGFRLAAMRYGGLSVGVPSMVYGLYAGHAEHGQVEFGSLLAPAIELAESGFPVSADLSENISDKLDLLMDNEAAAELYLEDGVFPPSEGETFVNPDLARTMRAIQTGGIEAFYGRESAERIAAAVVEAGGVMTAWDIMTYRPRVGTVLSTTYRNYVLHTMGPPSGGGLATLQILRILDAFPLADWGPRSPLYYALLIGAMEQAYESANRFIGDPRFIQIDLERLLSDAWVKEAHERMTIPSFDELPPDEPLLTYRPAVKEPIGNTTHLSVVDREGNMVALTQTINFFFGSGVAVPEMGIILNNELFDFTFEDGSPNLPAAGKVPRSSMAPTLVFKDGQPVATLGTPGGARIPAALAQILINMIDFDMSIVDAIAEPRLYYDAPRSRLSFEDRETTDAVEAAVRHFDDPESFDLRARGAFDRYFGGAQGIWIHDDAEGQRVLHGAADPRRGGATHGY